MVQILLKCNLFKLIDYNKYKNSIYTNHETLLEIFKLIKTNLIL